MILLGDQLTKRQDSFLFLAQYGLGGGGYDRRINGFFGVKNKDNNIVYGGGGPVGAGANQGNSKIIKNGGGAGVNLTTIWGPEGLAGVGNTMLSGPGYNGGFGVGINDY